MKEIIKKIEKIPAWLRFTALGVGVSALAVVLFAYFFMGYGHNNYRYEDNAYFSKGMPMGVSAGSARMEIMEDASFMDISMAFDEEGSSEIVRIMPPIEPPFPGEGGVAPEETERSIIRTGNLNVIVQSTEESVETVRGIVERAGGFETSSNFYEMAEGRLAGDITVRVPEQNFDAVMESIKSASVRVTNENTYAEDVTAQVADTRADLENKRAIEERYRGLLEQAENVSEILEVERELTQIRNQIERAETRLSSLDDRSSFSTINVSMTAEADVQLLGFTWSPLLTVKGAMNDLWDGVTRVLDDLIRFVITLPVLLIRVAMWLIAILVVINVVEWLWKYLSGKRSRKNASTKTKASSTTTSKTTRKITEK